MLMTALPSPAQNYKNSQYYNEKTGHLDYKFNNYLGEAYLGVRLGPAFTYVTSDDARLDGGKWQTGLNVGVVGGFALSESTPVFMETGLYYIEKGGKKDLGGGKKMTYDLNYLEIPVLVKYKYEVDTDFTVEPFAGGYFAMGVGGKIKNFAEREAQSSFRSNNFRRFDGGLRLGCGVGYDMFYADLTYDLNYLEIPVLVKYKYEVDDEFTVEPFAGGYFAMGVGGKIKNFAEREAQSSFRSNNFRRFDGGLRIGCGLGYDMFYADLSYDLGLANICHDDFDKARNRALIFNFGVNF